MRIKVLQLVRPVEVEGPSLFGSHRARVKFSPPEQGHDFEWMYTFPLGNTRIDAESVRACPIHNLAVVADGRTVAHVLEHLLPLKFFGLLGLSMSSTHCLPYFGNATPFVSEVLKASQLVTLDVPMVTVDQEYSWTYPRKRAGHTAFTTIRPRQDGKIVMYIMVDYPSLGSLTKTYTLPDDDTLFRITSVPSQGWPRYRYTLSKVLSLCGLWQHHRSIEWPQEYASSLCALERFADHRALDLLGALATLVNGHCLSADVFSVCSGHIADIEVCRSAQKRLVNITA